MNPRVNRPIQFHYFFTRKPAYWWGHSTAWVIFPGLRHARRAVRGPDVDPDGEGALFPVVLVGTEHWAGLVDWLRDVVLAAGRIAEADLRSSMSATSRSES